MATLNFPDSPDTGDIYSDSNSGFTYEWNGTVWISKDPSTASNIREIDDISSGFNGSTTAFTLQVASVNVEPANVQQLIISVGGVMQNAGDDYTVSGSTLTFTTAPTAGLTFFGTLLGTALSLNTVADGSVSPASLTTTSNYMMGGLTVDQNAGIITAYQFQGDGSGLTGVASTDNIITSYGATFLSNVRVAGIFTAANAYVTGILTAQTLNYNNVVDIYSTGIITATRGIQQTGNEGLHVSAGISTVGIFTATKATVGLGVTINNTGVDAGIGAGIITAKTYYGDASNMTGAGSTLSVSGFSPLPNSSQLSVNNVSIGLMFNQGVKAGSGELTLRKDSLTGTVVQNFGVGSSVSYVHGQAVIEPSAGELVNDQKYYLTVPDSGIQNMAGNSNIGAINEYYFNTKPYQAKLYGIGGSGYGIGNNSTISRPVQIGAKDDWNIVAGYSNNSSGAGTRNDGSMWAWGANTKGQLGQNNTTTSNPPVQVGTDKIWEWCSIGQHHVHAVKTDGTLWSWGYNNNYGALGLNDKTDRSSPTQVGTDTTWSKVGSGQVSGGGIKTDGTLWVWGWNDRGVLGQNNTVLYSSPIQIGTGTDWEGIAQAWTEADGGVLQAVKTDGTMWTCGANTNGQLGLNDQAHYSSPTQLPGTDWSSTHYHMGGGKQSTAAIKTDGTLWTWGLNGDGRLGHNNGTTYSSPKQVGTDTTWLSVNFSNEGCMATKTDNTLWGWGNNQYGELGQNNRASYSSPRQVSQFTDGGIAIGHEKGFQVRQRGAQ